MRKIMNREYYLKKYTEHRSNDNFMEVALTIKRYAKANSGLKKKDVAEFFGLPPSSISEYLKIADIPEDVRTQINNNHSDISFRKLLKIAHLNNEDLMLDALSTYREAKSSPRERGTYCENLIKKCKQLESDLDLAMQKMDYQGEFEGLNDTLQDLKSKIDEVLKHESSIDKAIDNLVDDIID